MAVTTDSILESIGNYIAGILSKVSSWLWANFKPVFDKIAAWIDSVSTSLSNVFNRLTTFIGDMYNTISSQISTLVNDALTFIGSIYDRVSASITELFDNVTGYIADTFNNVYEQMINIVDVVQSNVVGMFDAVVNKIKSIVSTISEWLGTLLDDVKLKISTLIDKAVNIVDAISTSIREWISNVVEVVGASLRQLMEAASEIPAKLSELGDSFMDAVENFVGRPLDELPSNLWTELSKASDALHADDQREIMATLNDTYLSGNSPPKNNDELRQTFKALIPESGVMRSVFLTFFGVLAAILSIGSITSANAQIMLQEYSLTSPYAILNPADAIRANHFGVLTDEEAAIVIRKNGHDISDAQRLLTIGKQAAPEGEALSWFLRGIYSEADLDKSLSKNGWNEQDKAALKKAAQVIPPVQDLITMAVREVFTPAIAERFGQFDEFPSQFEEWAAKLGLSEDWSRNYWASHWALPSPQMGFEMLHRRVIEESDLNLLLKAADVMPFWRDKIVKISYAPFTRVDIRRMHKVGVLNDTEIFEAYQDIGYDRDKAQRLSDFTIELNGDKNADDDVGLQELSRSNILGFYEDGLLNKIEANELLLNIGLSSEAANLYLTSVDMNEQRLERKADTSLILDRAKAGLITFEQAQDKLSSLNLETRELSKALTKLIRQQAQRTKLPTRADLDKMLLRNIIDDATYKDTLQLLGYSDVWTDRLYKLIKEA